MSDQVAEASTVLRGEDEEFRQLYEEHCSHEERLAWLQSRHVLTDEEKLEEVTLKKRKLFLKDRMAQIAAQHRPAVGS
jgi:uncharacterized protein YdcH (DUF465 family)